MKYKEMERVEDNYKYLYEDSNMLFEFYVLKIEPIIVYPECLLHDEEQNCLNCEILNRCNSPRSWCLRPYYNHKKGCPNFGKTEGCPPNIPMLDQIYNVNEPMYLIINEFDLKNHISNMQKKHPEWNYYQLSNIRYWQGKTISMNNKASAIWMLDKPFLVSTNWIESMGVDLIQTLKQYDIDLKFGKDLDYPKRITLAGTIIESELKNHNLDIAEIPIDNIYVKRLIKRK